MEYYQRKADDVGDFDRLLTDGIFNKSAISMINNTNGRGVTILVIPRTIGDIQDCLQKARQDKHQVSIRTGGHNWFNISLRGGQQGDGGGTTTTSAAGTSLLLLDLRHFDEIVALDGTTGMAIVGPAVLGQTLNVRAAEQGWCFPAGHCVGVPLGGYLLGGGFGWFQHALGPMAAELIVAMTIITAEDGLLEINDTTHPDWMWLARGAAAAFPAVVVSFTVQLQPLKPIIRHQTNLVRLEDYGRLMESLCQLQMEGKLSRQLEVSVVPASTPPSFVEPLKGRMVEEESYCPPNIMFIQCIRHGGFGGGICGTDPTNNARSC